MYVFGYYNSLLARLMHAKSRYKMREFWLEDCCFLKKLLSIGALSSPALTVHVLRCTGMPHLYSVSIILVPYAYTTIPSVQNQSLAKRAASPKSSHFKIHSALLVDVDLARIGKHKYEKSAAYAW